MTCAVEIELQLEKLREIMRRGELSVSFADGRQVTYRSVDELLKAIKSTEAELNAIKNPTTRRRRGFALTINRGL